MLYGTLQSKDQMNEYFKSLLIYCYSMYCNLMSKSHKQRHITTEHMLLRIRTYIPAKFLPPVNWPLIIDNYWSIDTRLSEIYP